MSDDKEVCEPPTLTSEQRNPFKTSESNKTDICPMTDLQSFIGKKDTLWHHFSKGPKHIEDCCPDGVSSSNLSKCLENKCEVVSNSSVCRSVVEGVDFNSTQTIDEQIKDKMKKAKITSQNKGEIYRAVIEQLMCNNAMFSLDKKKTYSKKCDKTTPKPPTKEGKNLQNCIDEYEKTPDAEKLKTCVDGLTDKTSTTDDKPSTNYYQKDTDWTSFINTIIAIIVILIFIVISYSNHTSKLGKFKNLIIIGIASIIISVLVGSYLSIQGSSLESFNIMEHITNKVTSSTANPLWYISLVVTLGISVILSILSWIFPAIRNILSISYIFVCSVIMIVLFPKTLLTLSVLNLIIHYLTKTKGTNFGSFIINNGVLLLLYTSIKFIGDIIYRYVHKNELNNKQNSFFLYQNNLYLIVLLYLLLFPLSRLNIFGNILGYFKGLGTNKSFKTPGSWITIVISIIVGFLFTIICAGLSTLGGFTSILIKLTKSIWPLTPNCMVDEKNCDINCDKNKKIKAFSAGFFTTFNVMTLFIVVIIFIILGLLLLYNRNCNQSQSFKFRWIIFLPAAMIITLIAINIIAGIGLGVNTSSPTSKPDSPDENKDTKKSNYNMDIICYLSILLISIFINFFSKKTYPTFDHKNNKIFNNSGNMNTTTDIIKNYIFFLLPHLDYINTKDNNIGRRSKNKTRMSGISGVVRNHLSRVIDQNSSKIMRVRHDP